MRSLIAALGLLLPLTATAETVTGTVVVVGSRVSLKVGAVTTPLGGDLSRDLSLLNGEAVELEAERPDKGKALIVRRIVSPERTEVNAVGATRGGKQVLLTDKGETLAPVGRTGLISTTKQRTFDVWRFPKADGQVRVSIVAYEAETTKSWIILWSEARVSIPSGYIRGRGRSVWVEEEKGDYLKIRRGSDVGWIPSGAGAALEVEPKGGLKSALEGAGSE